MSNRWYVLAALTFARAAMGFPVQSVAPVAPFLDADLGLDKTQLGWLIGIYLLPGIAFALPGGLLGARFGDRRLILAGLGLMAAGGAWLAYAASFNEATAARLVSGAGAVILNVLLTKLVADWFDGRERVLAMSVLINAWPIGIAIALLGLGPLALAAGWRLAMAGTALFAVAGFFAVLSVPERVPAAATQTAGDRLGLGVLTAREWRLLAIGSIPWLLFNAAYQVLVSFLPSFLLERGMSIAGAGSVSALNTVLFIVSVQAGGVLLKRARHPDLVCHLAMCGWCATLLLLAGGSTPLVWLVLGGLLGGLPASGLVSLPAEFLRPESRGAGMGVFYTIYYFGCALLPSAVGLLYDLSGSARTTLWASALAVFLCVPALYAFRRAMRTAAA
jgi:MFS family permease